MCALFLFSNSSAQKKPSPCPKLPPLALKSWESPDREVVEIWVNASLCQWVWNYNFVTSTQPALEVTHVTHCFGRHLPAARPYINWGEASADESMQGKHCNEGPVKTIQCGFKASTYILTPVFKLCLFLLHVWTSCDLWTAIYQRIAFRFLRYQHLHLSEMTPNSPQFIFHFLLNERVCWKHTIRKFQVSGWFRSKMKVHQKRPTWGHQQASNSAAEAVDLSLLCYTCR